ncbi:MAG: hypothetical protein J1F12_06225 [Muribaculaceae bacterium]|nr:hypothetical protein [Muribaculaceae bacterium]
MKKQLQEPTLDNILQLFSKRLEDFSGESKKSYQKALSSFQVFVMTNYSLSEYLESRIVENWVIFNILQDLSRKTVSFYLEKLSSLYTSIAPGLIGGKVLSFKEIKVKLKQLPLIDYAKEVNIPAGRILALWKSKKHNLKIPDTIEDLIFYSLSKGGIPVRQIIREKKEEVKVFLKRKQDLVSSSENHKILSSLIEEYLLLQGLSITDHTDKTLSHLWNILALKAGITADIIKSMMPVVHLRLGVLNLAENTDIDDLSREIAIKTVTDFLYGEEKQWFAMRLRPRVKFESLMAKFVQLNNIIKLPELFYPCEEIARKVGKKVIWEGKPVIRDIVFFRTRKSEIYPLFSKIYDLAWCYRTPGGGYGNYATIPAKAMDEFKEALGILSPAFEVAPAGFLELQPGDEVIIVTGDYARQHARILKQGTDDEEGNKVFRVSLLNGLGHWDIGIDARLLKKA